MKKPKDKTIKEKDGTVRDVKTGKLIKGAPQDTNKNGTAGRPTDYSPKICKEMLRFFSSPLNKVEEHLIEDRYGHETLKHVVVPNRLPTFEDFAEEIDVNPDTLHAWKNAKDENGELIHPEFSEAYKRCKGKQKWFLANHALIGNYNAHFAKFVAINITDWEDKSKVDNTHDVKNLSEILDAIQKGKGH